MIKTLLFTLSVFSFSAFASENYCDFYYKLESFTMKQNLNRHMNMKIKINISGSLPEVTYETNQASSKYKTTNHTMSVVSNNQYSQALALNRDLEGQTLVLSDVEPKKEVKVNSEKVLFASHVNTVCDGSAGLEDRGGLQILANNENWVSNPEGVMSERFYDILLFDRFDPDSVFFPLDMKPELKQQILEGYAKEIPFLNAQAFPSKHFYFVPVFKGQKQAQFEISDNTLDFDTDMATAKVRFLRSCK